jgi:hypothetical protein
MLPSSGPRHPRGQAEKGLRAGPGGLRPGCQLHARVAAAAIPPRGATPPPVYNTFLASPCRVGLVVTRKRYESSSGVSVRRMAADTQVRRSAAGPTRLAAGHRPLPFGRTARPKGAEGDGCGGRGPGSLRDRSSRLLALLGPGGAERSRAPGGRGSGSARAAGALRGLPLSPQSLKFTFGRPRYLFPKPSRSEPMANAEYSFFNFVSANGFLACTMCRDLRVESLDLYRLGFESLLFGFCETVDKSQSFSV